MHDPVHPTDTPPPNEPTSIPSVPPLVVSPRRAHRRGGAAAFSFLSFSGTISDSSLTFLFFASFSPPLRRLHSRVSSPPPLFFFFSFSTSLLPFPYAAPPPRLPSRVSTSLSRRSTSTNPTTSSGGISPARLQRIESLSAVAGHERGMREERVGRGDSRTSGEV